ncbi:MAG: DUF211 domain-containing protein [Chromatiales bacterium]|jgi:hypothetical protein
MSMVQIKRVVLDVLKPHQPNVLEFASTLAKQHSGICVQVVVTEMDEKTETTVVTLEGDNIPYDDIVASIRELGASVHSIDEVEVISPATATD